MATINESRFRRYSIIEKEMSSVTIFIGLADKCVDFRDIWCLHAGDLSLWQCILAFPPWFFDPHSPFLRLSSYLYAGLEYFDRWSLTWAIEENELKFSIRKDP